MIVRSAEIDHRCEATDDAFLFESSFNLSVKVHIKPLRLTSHAGVLLLSEVDSRLGFIESLSNQITDPRKPRLIRYWIEDLIRERIYANALGFSDDDDCDRLAHDPAMRIATWHRPGERVVDERLASQPTQSRLIGIVADHKENLEALRRSLSDCVARHLRTAGNGKAVFRGTIDVDSFPILAHGNQEGAAYNGYYKETVFHPLVAAFSPDGNFDHKRLGDGFVHAILRDGTAHTAQGAVRFILNAVEKCKEFCVTVNVRMDAGYTIGRVMDALHAKGIRFVGRLKGNAKLDKMAKPHLARSPGRPPKEGYEKIIELGRYQVKGNEYSWRYAYRLILVIVDKPDKETGNLCEDPRYFFLITNRSEIDICGEDTLEHYRSRGTFEDRIGELQKTIRPQLSSHKFTRNEARFLFYLLSFNHLSILRGEVESQSPNGWDLQRLQDTLLNAEAYITNGGRRINIHVGPAAGELWSPILQKVSSWRLPDRWPQPQGPTRRSWVPPPRHAHRSLALRE